MPSWKQVDDFKPQSAKSYIKSVTKLSPNHRKQTKTTVLNCTPYTADKTHIALLVHSLAVAETKRSEVLERSSKLENQLEALKNSNKDLSERNIRIFTSNLIVTVNELNDIKCELESQNMKIKILQNEIIEAEKLKTNLENNFNDKMHYQSDLKSLDDKLGNIEV
jgi:septal ring factor EnvC (AmiA/AmiB activator)